MQGLFSKILIFSAFASLLLVAYFFLISERKQLDSLKIVHVFATILAIWSLLTSWLWLYQINVYISLPAWLLALVFNLYSAQKTQEQKWVRFNFWVLFAAFVSSIAGYLYFQV